MYTYICIYIYICVYIYITTWVNWHNSLSRLPGFGRTGEFRSWKVSEEATCAGRSGRKLWDLLIYGEYICTHCIYYVYIYIYIYTYTCYIHRFVSILNSKPDRLGHFGKSWPVSPAHISRKILLRSDLYLHL